MSKSELYKECKKREQVYLSYISYLIFRNKNEYRTLSKKEIDNIHYLKCRLDIAIYEYENYNDCNENVT